MPTPPVHNCTDCPGLVDNRTQIVNGTGPDTAEIVLVGEAPGATEDETGEPFTGQSGTILDETLETAGLSREDIRITNCVRCRPPDNRDPHVAELNNCQSYLHNELSTVDPAVVVPMGRIPVTQLFDPEENLTDIAGETRNLVLPDWEGRAVISVHPAATIYNRDLRPVLETTFKTVAELAP